MIAPDPITYWYPNIFRHYYGKAWLDTRQAFLFGSGTAGAGGRLLVSSDGKLLLPSSAAYRELNPFVLGRFTMIGEESDVNVERVDKLIIKDSTLSWKAGEWETYVGGGWEASCDSSVRYEAEGMQKNEVDKPSLKTSAVLAAWNALIAHQAPTHPAADLRPEKATVTQRTQWRQLGQFNPRTARSTIDVSASMSLRYTDLRPDTAGGLEQLSASQYTYTSREILGLLLGHYGRHDASPHLVMKGTLKNSSSTTKPAFAQIRLYRASTDSADFLTKEESQTMPQWEQVASETIEVDTTADFSVPVRMQGGIIYLFTLETLMGTPSVSEDVPYVPSSYLPEYSNWTDEDGYLVGNWRAYKSTEYYASVGLQALRFEPDMNATSHP